MLDNVKIAIYRNLEELFGLAAVDDMCGDTAAYGNKLDTIAQIAAILGIPTEILSVNINLKAEDGS
jgi:hypothetical protein